MRGSGSIHAWSIACTRLSFQGKLVSLAEVDYLAYSTSNLLNANIEPQANATHVFGGKYLWNSR